MKFEDNSLIKNDEEKIDGIINGYQLLHSFINLYDINVNEFNPLDPMLEELKNLVKEKDQKIYIELAKEIKEFVEFRFKYISLSDGPFNDGSMLSYFQSELIAVPIEGSKYRIDAIRYNGDYALPFDGDWSIGSNYLEKKRSYNISSEDDVYLITEYDKWVFNEMGQTNLVSIYNPSNIEMLAYLKFLALNHFIDEDDIDFIMEKYNRLKGT